MKRLRWTFISIASGAVLLVLSLVLVTLYFVSTVSTYAEIYSIAEYILENSGKLPHIEVGKETTDFAVYREMQYETRYFSLLTDDRGNIIGANFDNIAFVDDRLAEDLLSETFDGDPPDGHDRGMVEDPQSSFGYVRKELDGDEMKKMGGSTTFYKSISGDHGQLPDSGYIYVFVDCSRRIIDMRSLRVSTIVIGLGSFLLFFLIISGFSKRAIQPYIDNHEKQKQFITNAGHELKTPLTIISANMEVLEMIEGKNEWTESTLNQVKRLTRLVGDLITIARTEEYDDEKLLCETVDASAAVKELCESFAPVAEKEGKRIETVIEDGVTVSGDGKMLGELFSILIDNAVKYCDDKGCVRVELSRRKKGLMYCVSNDYAEGKNVDYSRFFERFYRGDTSHNSQKAGYGIGLSMAQSITKLHKGRISAGGSGGVTTFTVNIP